MKLSAGKLNARQHGYQILVQDSRFAAKRMGMEDLVGMSDRILASIYRVEVLLRRNDLPAANKLLAAIEYDLNELEHQLNIVEM